MTATDVHAPVASRWSALPKQVRIGAIFVGVWALVFGALVVARSWSERRVTERALSDFVVGGTRPVTVRVPPGLRSDDEVPLLILLHGYGDSGQKADGYMHMSDAALAAGMVFAAPDGTRGEGDNRFWNGTDACCDFGATGVDDSAYLLSVINQIEAIVDVDRSRVFLVGHSNGAFMSFRMACEHADEVTAIVSLAGAGWKDPARCTPSQPVSVLAIHGTADATVAYDGGTLIEPYPAITDTVEQWAGLDGCAPQPSTTAPPRQLTKDSGPATVLTYAAGCDDHTAVALWSIPDGTHIPALAPDFATQVVAYLDNLPRR